MTSDAERYYRELPDGTIKQVNPFTGTQVWTVPGRGARPLGRPAGDAAPLGPHDRTRACAFCADRHRETPPEKARLVRPEEVEGSGAGATRRLAGMALLDHVGAGQLDATTAQFRRVPNLFEILSWQYWQLNHGQQPSRRAVEWQESYLADPAGRAHVMAVLDAKFAAMGIGTLARDLDEAGLREATMPFFAGGHDVVVARRHYTDEATTTAGLAGVGTLDVAEHRAFVGLTVETMRDLYESCPQARLVVAFQNWLAPAGASFDHLHKQLVAVDEVGRNLETLLPKAAVDPDIHNRYGPDFAADHGLVLARNDHAVATVGFGHRYPSLEIWSTSRHDQPWRMEPEEVAGLADLLHAMHVAVGPQVASNEEWHHRPVGVGVPVPWRVNLKLRVSTLAGFEGGTKIYVNTIPPTDLAARLLPALFEARDEGRIAPMELGDECRVHPGMLASTRRRWQD